MYKRVRALLIILCMLVPLMSLGDSHQNSTDEESFFYALYHRVTTVVKTVCSHIWSMLTGSSGCSSADDTSDYYHIPSSDTALPERDPVIDKKPLESAHESMQEYPWVDEEDDTQSFDDDQQPLGFTQTDLVQLLEQLQEALGEPEQLSFHESCDDASCSDPSCSTVQELLRELEYAPIVCDDTDLGD